MTSKKPIAEADNEPQQGPNPYKCLKCGRVKWYFENGKTHRGLCTFAGEERLVRMKRVAPGTYYQPRRDRKYLEVRFTSYDALWHAVYRGSDGKETYDRIKESDVQVVIGWLNFTRPDSISLTSNIKFVREN